MPAAKPQPQSVDHRWLAGGGMVALGSFVTAWHLLAILADRGLAAHLVSEGLWRRIVALCGGTARTVDGQMFATINHTIPLLLCLFAGFAAWFVGAASISFRTRRPWRDALAAWGLFGWGWWLLPLAWEALDLVVVLSGWSGLQSLLHASLPLWHSLQWAGWLTTALALCQRPSVNTAAGVIPPQRAVAFTPSLPPWPVCAAMLAYFAAFAAMNLGLYAAMLLPHGDSAMYEEHLWNLLHGKGFRSYLDDGRLFLGEHVQVVHVLLVPLYLLWPSQALLELCQSAALAAGAIPAYLLAFRHTGSSRAATALAIAYLLYVPMQFLDIAVDLKTFRPNSFEIPLFLAAFNAMERGRWRWFALWLVLALSCQEDAAVIVGPLGVWLAVNAARLAPQTGNAASRLRLAGIALAIFGVLYVVVVIKFVLPAFRGGGDVHFAKYFEDFGDSSDSIFVNVLKHPAALFGRLTNVESILFGLTLLASLGFLPLLSTGRLAVAAPLFAVLCLSDITNSPLHHFHAPLVPVVIWSAAAGLARVPAILRRFFGSEKQSAGFAFVTAAEWGLMCAATTGLFLGLSPLSIGFWDSSSRAYWQALYIPGERARKFPPVWEQIPPDARVASTDFVHPRFTHHARSYDYSDYRPNVPDDADYIVVDTTHPYSQIHRPEQVKEYRDHPDHWELLPDRTNGYYIVLKRRHAALDGEDGG